MGDSWYKGPGYDGMEQEQERLDSMRGPTRFWMPPETDKEVVFVDEDPACVYEHNPKIGGVYKGNQFTCLQGSADDVVCCQKLGIDTRYYIGYYTVVDCTAWTDDRGVTHQYELKLLPAKLKSLKRFRRKKEEDGALAGLMFRAHREDDKSPNIGDEWSKMRSVEMDKLFAFVRVKGSTLEELFTKAEEKPEEMVRIRKLFAVKPDEKGKLPRVIPTFNYFEVLKPKAPKDLRLILGAVEPEANRKGNSGSGKKQSEEEVPF